MLNQRFFALAVLGVASAISTSAWSWSWSFGPGERVRGSGELVSETRQLEQFDAISVAGDFKVSVRQGNAAKLEVRADSNLLALIETRIVASDKGATLEIAAKPGYTLLASVTPEITLQMAQLRAVSVAGSGEVSVAAMQTPSVHVGIAGSGEVKLIDLSSEHLGLKVSGSGDISASGHAASLTVSVAGSGDVKARALEANEVKVSIAGSGDVQVHALKKLRVSIAGSGSVDYLGSPEISTSVAGSGTIRRITN